MPGPNIVLATTTFYRSMNDIRVPLALQMIQQATNHVYTIHIVDGGSPPEFTQKIWDMGPGDPRANPFSGVPWVHKQENPGMGASRRQAIRHALEETNPDDIIVLLEPEKHTFVPLISEVWKPFREDPNLDLVIPRRRSLESYPPMQKLAEELGREGFRLATGRALDSWFGPQAFRARVASYYLDYTGKPDLWDSINIPAAQIVKSGRKVTEVVVDYQHPPEQLEEDTFDFYQKRIRQLTTLCNALANI